MKDKYTLFLDFDNTITKFDVLDDMMERFSRDDNWLKLEERWKSGEIGSRECLDGQIRSLRISGEKLDSYLSTVEIDPAFGRLMKLCEEFGIRKMILSDNFGIIIERILKNNGIGGIDIFSNSLKISDDMLLPEFPLSGGGCNRCAHCKTATLKRNISPGSRSVYVGDGLSDFCPSRKSDIVFAKSSLGERLKAENVPFMPFGDLNDVYGYLKEKI